MDRTHGPDTHTNNLNMNGAAIAHEQRTSTWQNDPDRAPALQEHDTLIYDEPGRIVYWTDEKLPGQGVDCRSHWFRIVRQYGSYCLLVRHGAGDERVKLGGWGNFRAMFEPLSSDARYSLMHQMMNIHREAKMQGAERTAAHYRQAFIEGRLKKRKMPRQSGVKVWIEEPTATPA